VQLGYCLGDRVFEELALGEVDVATEDKREPAAPRTIEASEVSSELAVMTHALASMAAVLDAV